MIAGLDWDRAVVVPAPLACSVCRQPAEYALVDGTTWHQLRYVRADASNRVDPRCADHGLCVLPFSAR